MLYSIRGIVTEMNREDILPFYRIADAVETLRPGVENSGHVGECVERCAFYDVQHGDARHAVFCFQKEWYCAYNDGAAHAVSNKLIHAINAAMDEDRSCKTRTRSEGAAEGSEKTTRKRL
jgi:hypothetical protein